MFPTSLHEGGIQRSTSCEYYRLHNAHTIQEGGPEKERRRTGSNHRPSEDEDSRENGLRLSTWVSLPPQTLPVEVEKLTGGEDLKALPCTRGEVFHVS
ncbi:MAG: hypothetical protein C4294_11720, partial [Nitrospiraceae bacterium]